MRFGRKKIECTIYPSDVVYLMTPQQETIITNLIHPALLRMYAGRKKQNDANLRTDLVIEILSSSTVYSELGLNYKTSNYTISDLEQAFSNKGFSCRIKEDVLVIQMRNMRFTAQLHGGYMTNLTCGRRSIALMFTPDSIVSLACFADEVLPNLEKNLADIDLELDKNEMAGNIVATSLRYKLSQTGVPYMVRPQVSASEVNMEITVFLEPSGKLSVTVPAEEVGAFVKRFDEILRSAEVLYKHFGEKAVIEELTRFDIWAEPYNPIANQP